MDTQDTTALLLQKLASAEKVKFTRGTPNPSTRRGRYLTVAEGLSSPIFFVGYGLTKEPAQLIVEAVG